jgi:hypothetical protein
MLVGRVRVLCYDLHEAALSVPYLLGQFELCDLFHFVWSNKNEINCHCVQMNVGGENKCV